MIRSTVLPGTMDTVVRPAIGAHLRASLPGRISAWATMPEFLREGQGVEDFYQPAVVVIGAEDDETAARCCGR